MVYTPMGCVHRFQMFTPYENNAIVTPLEGKMRPIHITVEDYGPPVATAPGFVIKGTQNIGPFPDTGDRCPLSEWRMVRLDAGDRIDESTLFSNEHWLVITGSVLLGIDGRDIELTAHDVALLRTGFPRGLYTRDGARMIVARERCNEL